VLDGRLSFARQAGRWSLTGDAALAALDATGPLLQGDHLRLERVAGSWDVGDSGSDGGWVLRRVDVQSPIAALKSAGPLPAPPGTTTRLDGTLDLAALARQLPHALRLREGITLDRGSARLQATAQTEAQTRAETWEVEASVSDLLAHDGGRALTLEAPATLSGRLVRQQGAWSVDRLALKTAFLELIGVGDLDTEVAWTGRVDLEGLQRQLRQLVDFGPLELAGRGNLAGEYRRQGPHFNGHLAATLRGFRIGGLSAGALERDQVALDTRLTGPASAEGLPRGWDQLQLGLNSGDFRATLAATAQKATVTVAGPLTLSGHKGRLEGGLDARWNDAGATIDQAHVALRPEAEAGEPLVLAVRGRYDRARGELVLRPAALDGGAAPEQAAIALDPDGLRLTGLGKGGRIQLEGAAAGDLAAVGRLLRTWGVDAPASLGGPWSAQASVREVDGAWLVGGKLDVRDLYHPADEPSAVRSPGAVRLSWNATYQPRADQLDFTELVVASRYVTVEAAGRVSDLDQTCRVDLLGTLTPDFPALNRLLAENVEPGARLTGRPRPIHVQGALGGAGDDWLKALDAEVGFDLDHADVFGMSLGPTPIVLSTRGGRLQLAPIDTSLNQGRIHLEPEVVLDDPAGAALRLGPESWVADARINDDVTRRVLAFAAPVLDRATRARGRVSLRLQEASLPIGGPDPLKRTRVTGAVVFQDAEFTPGAIANQLYDLIGVAEEKRPTLRLNQPIALTIADRRVYQRGLVIPIAQFNEITMEGWVDFDRNLALTASLPLMPTMFRDQQVPVLSNLLNGLRISVPIRGTLASPVVDREVFNTAMRDLGKTLLDRAAPNAADLLQRLFGPRDPAAPPPLTPEERRARRQQRREQRQATP
jgi:translocation and assembly module TamB